MKAFRAIILLLGIVALPAINARFLFSARRLHDNCEDQCQAAYQVDIQTCMERGKLEAMKTTEPDTAAPQQGAFQLVGAAMPMAGGAKRRPITDQPSSVAAFRRYCEETCEDCKSNLRDCLDDCQPADPVQACKDVCHQRFRKGSYGLWSCLEGCTADTAAHTQVDVHPKQWVHNLVKEGVDTVHDLLG